MSKKIEVGEVVILTGFAFDRSRKEDRAVTAIEIDPPIVFGDGERSAPFVRIAIDGVSGWFTVQGDRIPVGPGELKFRRKG